FARAAEMRCGQGLQTRARAGAFDRGGARAVGADAGADRQLERLDAPLAGGMVLRRTTSLRGREHAPCLSRTRARRQGRDAAVASVRRNLRARSRCARGYGDGVMNQVVRLADIMAKVEEDAGSDRGSPLLDAEHLRMLEAVLFAASEPLDETALARSLPQGANLSALLAELREIYRTHGVNLVKVAEKWQFRTAPDLSFLLRREKPEQKRLSR